MHIVNVLPPICVTFFKDQKYSQMEKLIIYIIWTEEYLETSFMLN